MLTLLQQQEYMNNGYLVLPGFFSNDEMSSIKNAANKIVDDFDPSSTSSIFSTKDHDKTRNDYFLSSSDKIRCFYEEDAFSVNGELVQEKSLSINKIGHALHTLDPAFSAFSHSPKIAEVAKSVGLQTPRIRQSMYIFKQPKIGGIIRWHQDATYFYTDPISVVTFWVAVEDATIENGCLRVQTPDKSRASTNTPLREQFLRYPDDTTELKVLDETPWPEDESATVLDVKKGTLVVFNGLLPHFSAPNLSSKSRHAFTLHITCDSSKYSEFNWIQNEGSPLN
ncbi:phytanoyl-CoA dioxygenase family protein [Agaribacter marinus]|uniref:Phytanoyl-CoA dioxygenase n=1 Tax=Agaribacter marinus TaxID=1431249 RepID=A0AA37SVI7_9ALTE|nr:phytanoyl-CoA dioxygenase family protein [Agaribacter marinus]GLR70303.1 phytanoyl-CoA dioxygenase [Agaribacter marinus]